MKHKNIITLATIILGISFASFANAVCPLCVVAVGAGLGLSRWLGVDDVISSMWIGALLYSLSMWTVTYFENKNWKFNFYRTAIFLFYYLLTFVPLYYYEIIGHPFNKIFGIDKIVFGATLGTIIFFVSYQLHLYLKKKNGDKVFFNYQKVVLPVLILLIISLIIYFI